MQSNDASRRQSSFHPERRFPHSRSESAGLSLMNHGDSPQATFNVTIHADANNGSGMTVFEQNMTNIDLQLLTLLREPRSSLG